jgi:chromosome segregation ATPase
MSKRTCLSFAALLVFGACQSASELMYEPKPTDRLDGYEGSLPQAGINTEMDWGHQQNRLLTDFKTLKEDHALLQKRLDQELATSQNLKVKLNEQTALHEQERKGRAEIAAQLELKNQRVREMEATILSLRIEKAKVEQENLYAKINALKQSLDQIEPGTVEAAATPPGRK